MAAQFNVAGLAALEPKHSGGPVIKLDPAVVVNALPKAVALQVARAASAPTHVRVIDLSSLSPELRALDAEAGAAGGT